MQILNPLLTDDQDVSKVKKLERKYKLKNKSPLESNSQCVDDGVTSLSLNNELLLASV